VCACRICVGRQHSVVMDILEPEMSSQQDLQASCPESHARTSTTDDLMHQESRETAAACDSALVTFRHTDLDNLPCWIGCIQLDHPYNCHRSSVGSGSFQSTPLGCTHEDTEPTNTDADPQCWHKLVDVKNRWVGLLDHAYESSSWDSGSTGDYGRWDHAYNIQCSVDDPSSSLGRSVSGQHLDHSYDTQMSSELSRSETVLSSFLDHAYFASDWVATSGKRYTSGPRWSSSEDLRTVGRAASAFVW